MEQQEAEVVREPCKYYQRGNCKRGDTCNFAHVTPMEEDDGDMTSSSSDEEERTDDAVPYSERRSAPKPPRSGGGPSRGGGWGNPRGLTGLAQYVGRFESPARSNKDTRQQNGRGGDDRGRGGGRGGKGKGGGPSHPVRRKDRFTHKDHTPRVIAVPAFARKHPQQKKLTIVVLSDTHTQHEAITPLPQGDDHILIHCGDFTHLGTPEDVEDFNNWLGKLRYAHKFVISGNHERLCGPIQEHDQFQELITNAYFVVHEYIQLEEFGGLTLFLSSWDKKVRPNAEESEEAHLFPWDDKHLRRGKGEGQDPRGIDILVTHQPPKGILDQTRTLKHRGCPQIGRLVKEIKPVLHLFGHLHHGGERISPPGETSYINAANLGDKGAIVVEYYYDP